jgi:[acyl-carrier-protein] S-malonyltransferase
MDASRTALLFPGQGSQFIGMGQQFLESDSDAKQLMAMAEEKSGFLLQELCTVGPLDELTRTVHLQPAMTVMNIICWQALKKAGVKADYFAGHSLGEYSALVASGVLSPEDAITLVTERGRLMCRESKANPGAMSAILKLEFNIVEKAVADSSDKGVVVVANHNSDQQIVISGESSAVESAASLAEDRGGRAISLPVSAAMHSPLMAGAVRDFSKFLEGVAFQVPVGTILFNVTAETETDPAVIKEIMSRQIASMVKWYDIINKMRNNGVTQFIEVGPKKVLTGLMKKILPKGSGCNCFQVDSPESLSKCVDALI